jgi:hypothetical protein
MPVPPTVRRWAWQVPILKSSTRNFSSSGGLANGPVSRNVPRVARRWNGSASRGRKRPRRAPWSGVGKTLRRWPPHGPTPGVLQPRELRIQKQRRLVR